MAYRIGQIRKQSNVNYLEDIRENLTPTDIATEGFAKTFYDFALKTSNDNPFNAKNSYYLRFSIQRYSEFDFQDDEGYGSTVGANDPRSMYLRLILAKHDAKTTGSQGRYAVGEYQSISDTLKIDPYFEGINNEWATFDLIFTPNNTYSYLGFILNRCSYDYRTADRNPFTEEGRLNYDTMGDIAIINNILTTPSVVDKIGVQTRPGTLLCVNKQGIRVGKSGVYEINNGIPISFVGITAPNGDNGNNIDKFILDYAWDAEE